jgi:hypothetical protein
MYCRECQILCMIELTVFRTYGTAQTSQQALHALILVYHADTMQHTSVHLRRIFLGLKLSLQLQSNLDRLKLHHYVRRCASHLIFFLLNVPTECVTVTAPQAAMPPAMKPVSSVSLRNRKHVLWLPTHCLWSSTSSRISLRFRSHKAPPVLPQHG